MIAYSASNPDKARLEIYTIRTDGSHRRQLTTTGGLSPAWSADGTQLAFTRSDGIWLMDASGGSQRRLADGGAPAWSPDGTRVSYACRDGNALCVVDLQTATETVVVTTTPDWIGVGSSTWSPDGDWIALTRRSVNGDDYTGYRQLFRVHPDGTGLTEIPNTYPEGDLPAWSPDGDRILYTERYDGRSGEFTGDLYSIRPDGSDKATVTQWIGRDQAGAWSPDGQRIALESDGFLYPRQRGIWISASDGTSRSLVVRDGEQPSWRPHFAATSAPPPPVSSRLGARIAYVAATDAGYDLFSVRPDGSRTRRLTFHGHAQEPVWSPNHNKIAYVGESARGTFLQVLDVRSGRSHRIARSGYDAGGPAWSPDGRWLAWGRSLDLVVLHLGTRERYRIRITSEGGCCPRDLTWSPDGRWIAFSEAKAVGSSHVTMVRAKGGPLRHVTRIGGEVEHLDWSPNGRRIVLTHLTGPWWEPAADVWSVKPDGTGLRSISTTPEFDLTPAWSPDGSRVALYSDGSLPFGATPTPGLWTVGPRGGARELVQRDRTIAYVDW